MVFSVVDFHRQHFNMSSRVGRQSARRTRTHRSSGPLRARSRSLSHERSRSPSRTRESTSSVQHEAPPAWAQALLSQVEQLKAAAERSSCQDAPGEASDTDTEFEKVAHKDQYEHNKKVASIFRAIKKHPSRAVEFAEKGEQLVAERNKLIRIADSDVWDTVRIYLKKSLVESEAEKKRLKEARDLALSRRRGNGSRSRSKQEHQVKALAPNSWRPTSRSPSPKRNWRYERRQQFFRGRREEESQRLCFACGKPGHFQRFCPDRRISGTVGSSSGGLPQQ